MADEMKALSVANVWKRPEGKAGLIIPAIIGAVVIYFFGSALGTFVVNAFDNMLHLVAVGTLLILTLWVLTDSKFRTLGFYLYMSIMRWFTGIFIDMDPIGILKTYMGRMNEKLEEMKRSLDALKGQKSKVERLLAKNRAELENQMRLMQQAEQAGDQRSVGLNGKQAGRLQTMQQRFTADLDRLNMLIIIMDRYFGLCQDTIVDMGNEIKFRETESEYAKESKGVVRKAQAILRGLPESEMWDDSIAKLESDYNAAIGEVNNFLTMTESILKNADYQDGADMSKAMQLLDEWTKKNTQITLGGINSQVSKADIISDATRQLSGSTMTPMPSYLNSKQKYGVPVKTDGDDDYRDLFAKK